MAIAPHGGEVQNNGTCLASSVRGVAPGQYRIVATNYQWTAACTVTLVAQPSSGQSHNIRFVTGEDGCEEELVPLLE